MGENGRKYDDDDEISSSLFPLDLTDEMNLAMKSCIASTNYDATKDLKRLGLERLCLTSLFFLELYSLLYSLDLLCFNLTNIHLVFNVYQ